MKIPYFTKPFLSPLLPRSWLQQKLHYSFLATFVYTSFPSLSPTHRLQYRSSRSTAAILQTNTHGCSIWRSWLQSPSRPAHLTPFLRPYINATQLDESRVVLHGLSDQLCRSGLSLCVNNRGFLVLLRLLHHVLRALRLLLGCISYNALASYRPAWLRRRW